MSKRVLRQLPTFAARTYKGGGVLRRFVGQEPFEDDFYPEDWISSFTEAKNRNYVPDEGISRVLVDGEERLITQVVTAEDFGPGRENSGVLIKLLDSAERLGIQVHPTKEYAKRIFDADYGKTECWYILGKRDESACVYLGFKEHVTREYWQELFQKQDIDGMLNCLHRLNVSPGDVILVTGGTPHAIGAGCFMIEIQEPSDYTMRVEKVTVAGEVLTPQQIHYGAGEEAMLDCFDYTPMSEDELRRRFVLKPSEGKNGEQRLVTYDDTPCFALSLVDKVDYNDEPQSFVTLVALADGGVLECGGNTEELKRGDRFFVPAGVEYTLKGAKVVICYPPKKG